MRQEVPCPTLRAYVNQQFPNSVYGVYTEMANLFQTSTMGFYGESSFKEHTVIGDFDVEESMFPNERLDLEGENWELKDIPRDKFEMFRAKMKGPYSKKTWRLWMDTKVDIPYLGRIYVESLWVEPLELFEGFENLKKEGYLNAIKFIVPENLKRDYHLRMTYNKIKGVEKCK